MQKIVAFLNKHSIIINSISIAFWLFIIYNNYQIAMAENSMDERKTYFIIPVFFIILSAFNMYMTEKRKNKA